jgi:hypothetical protein
LADIDADIAGIAARDPQRSASDYAPGAIAAAMAQVLEPAKESALALQPAHSPPARVRAGEDLSLSLTLAPEAMIDSARLWFRHLHQGERWQVIDMKNETRAFAAAIPAAYVISAFPLQYYFEVRAKQSAAMCPGFGKDFTGTPYFLVTPS